MKPNVIENKKIALTLLPCPWYNSILSNPCLELSSYFFVTSLTLWNVLSVVQMVKHLPTMWEAQLRSLGWEDPLEKEMETHSSILAWKIPWTEESGRLQSMGLPRVGHDWVTWLSSYSIKAHFIYALFSVISPVPRLWLENNCC